MATKYKLPAPDGKIILVEARQAGQIIQDSAGNDLEVPTLLELKRLEAVEESLPAERAGGWNRGRGAMFVVGAVLAILAATVAWQSYGAMPEQAAAEDPTEVKQPDLNELSVVQLYNAWVSMKNFPLEAAPLPETAIIAERRNYLWTLITIAAAVGALGILLIGGAFVLPKPRQ